MASDPSPATSESTAARSAGGNSPCSSARYTSQLRKAVAEKTLGNRTHFFVTQVNNKTAAESFSQNQPVAARGINNKNFYGGATGNRETDRQTGSTASNTTKTDSRQTDRQPEQQAETASKSQMVLQLLWQWSSIRAFLDFRGFLPAGAPAVD